MEPIILEEYNAGVKYQKSERIYLKPLQYKLYFAMRIKT